MLYCECCFCPSHFFFIDKRIKCSGNEDTTHQLLHFIQRTRRKHSTNSSGSITSLNSPRNLLVLQDCRRFLLIWSPTFLLCFILLRANFHVQLDPTFRYFHVHVLEPHLSYMCVRLEKCIIAIVASKDSSQTLHLTI